MLKNPTIYFQLWYENASQANICTHTIISFSIRSTWAGGRFWGLWGDGAWWVFSGQVGPFLTESKECEYIYKLLVKPGPVLEGWQLCMQ